MHWVTIFFSCRDQIITQTFLQAGDLALRQFQGLEHPMRGSCAPEQVKEATSGRDGRGGEPVFPLPGLNLAANHCRGRAAGCLVAVHSRTSRTLFHVSAISDIPSSADPKWYIYR